MSMAARAINSRAVSSMSLAGIIGLARSGATPGNTLAARRRGSAASGPVVLAQLVFDRVHEGLPRGLDDVVGDADRPPRLVAVARRDEHARLGAGALGLVQDSNLVVEERHLGQARVEVGERLSKGVIEGVDGPVAGRRRVLGDALHLDPDRRFGDRLLGAVLLFDDDAIAVEVE